MNPPSDKAKSLDEILAEMQAVCDAATSGPWLSGYPNAGVIHELPGEIWNAEKDMICEYVPQIEDRKFIAMSREAVPRLIQCLQKAIEQRDKALSLLDKEYHGGDSKYLARDILDDNAELFKILQGRS